MPTFEKNGNTYRAVISVTRNGVRKRKSKRGFKTKTEAMRWAYEQEGTKNDLIKLQKNVSNNPTTFPDAFEDWYWTFKEPNIKESTKVWYLNTIKILNNYFKNVETTDITLNDVQKVLNKYGSTRVKDSAKKLKNHISAFLRYSYDNDLIKKDFTRSLIASYGAKSKDKDLKFLEEEDMKKLILETKSSNSVSGAMIYISLLTGLRIGEISALKSNDIDLINSTIRVDENWDKISEKTTTPKTKTSMRTISISNDLVEFLKRWIKEDKTELMFTGSDGWPITNEGANKQLKNLINKLNLSTPITFHGLRHTHASFLLSKDVSLQYVSERLGHADLNITMKTYAHLFQNKRVLEQNKAINLLDNLK